MAGWRLDLGSLVLTVFVILIVADVTLQTMAASLAFEPQSLKMGMVNDVSRFHRSMVVDRSLQAPRDVDNTCPTVGCSLSNQRCCGLLCVDVVWNSDNCGGCSNKCAWGRQCCRGICVDTQGSDRLNCGSCGFTCPFGMPCNFGLCGYNSGK